MVKLKTCHDCGCREGELHLPGCDMERCPFCLNQLISCKCCYEHLGIDCSRGTFAYNHGLTDEQSKMFDKILETKGLIPYIQVPNLCVMCGRLWPEMFQDDDWEKYVIPQLQQEILCKECFERMKLIFPDGWRKAKQREVKGK